MLGRTNAGGGGSSFSATIEVTTDANAVITAVNLAGDTFSGTADSNGELTLVVNKPGTYTVTETDGGEKIVYVIDDGASYTVEVYAFDGTFIADGIRRVDFEYVLLSGGTPPTVTTRIINNLTVLEVAQPTNTASIFRTSEAVDISGYTKIRVRCDTNSSYIYIAAFDEQDNQTNIISLPSGYLTSETGITSLDSTKKYKFGVQLNSGWTVDFVTLQLVP